MSKYELIQAKTSRPAYAPPRRVLPHRPFLETQPGLAPGKPKSPDSEARQEGVKSNGFNFRNVRARTGNQKSDGAGRALPELLRQKMEASFKTDFSSVRVHEDDTAKAIGANAYTRGNEIRFRRGKYQPGSKDGQALIGHELTHVLQQRTGRINSSQGEEMSINRDPGLEAEADALGHRAAMGNVVTIGTAGLSAAAPQTVGVVGAAGVVQCQDSDDEDSDNEGSDDEGSDDEYVEHVPKKRKVVDPKSNIKKGSTTTSTDPNTNEEKMSYETEGGIKHNEIFDPSNSTSTVTSSGLKWGEGFRNKTIREKGNYQVYNPYGLSAGQSSRNQAVVSHQTPSWFGMGAGGQFSNNNLASPVYNSAVDQKERPWRDEVKNTTNTFSYQTVTQTEPLVDDDRIEEIAQNVTNPKWTKERIKKRLERVEEKHPGLERVSNQRRTLTNEKTKNKRTAALGPDLHVGLPARAFSKDAHAEYLQARGTDSGSSDDELKEPKQKKRKKRG